MGGKKTAAIIIAITLILLLSISVHAAQSDSKENSKNAPAEFDLLKTCLKTLPLPPSDTSHYTHVIVFGSVLFKGGMRKGTGKTFFMITNPIRVW